MSFYRNQLESWLKTLDIKADYALDIGGGQKPFTEKRVKSWDVGKYEIMDNDGQYKPTYLHDLNKPLNKVYENSHSSFDVIFCLEVFEYIYNPVEAHKTIFKLLDNDGVAYISYPTIYPLHNPVGIDYLRYTKNAIKKYLRLSGFESWEIIPRIATEGASLLASFYSVEQMRPIKHTREIFDIGYLVIAKKGEIK